MPADELMRFICPVADEDCDCGERHCAFFAVLDHLPVGVYMKDAASLRYVYRNRLFEQLRGRGHGDSVGRTAHELFPADVADRFVAADREALARGILEMPEVRAAGADGVERILRSSKTVVRDRAGRPRLIVGVWEDVTEMRRTEDALRAANADLERRVHTRTEELERAGRISQMGQMAAGLAHEINQPLAAIIYTLTGAVNRARAGALNNAQMLEALQAAIAHAHRSADILARVRDMANKHSPRHLPLRLNEAAAEMVDLCARTAAEVGVRLRFLPAPHLPEVRADRVQIEQVLLNLLRNGIDAVAEKDGLRREVVVSTALADEGTVEVSVEDSGTGLAPERLKRMFVPFFTTKKGGMGLGLAICQSIVEDHGGRLWAAARAEGGLCMRFTLPLGTAGKPPRHTGTRKKKPERISS